MFEAVGRTEGPRRRGPALLLSVLLNGTGIVALFLVGSHVVPEPARAEDPIERYVEIAAPAAAAAPAGNPAAAPKKARSMPRSSEAPPPLPTPPDVPTPPQPSTDAVVDAGPPTGGDGSDGGGNGGGEGPGTGPGTGPGDGPGGDGEGPRVVHWSEIEPRVRVKPTFPEAARALGLTEGACVVRIFVDAHGVPTRAEPRECPGPFSEPTVTAAMKWRFYPVKVQGVAVPAQFELRVKYASD